MEINPTILCCPLLGFGAWACYLLWESSSSPSLRLQPNSACTESHQTQKPETPRAPTRRSHRRRKAVIPPTPDPRHWTLLARLPTPCPPRRTDDGNSTWLLIAPLPCDGGSPELLNPLLPTGDGRSWTPLPLLQYRTCEHGDHHWSTASTSRAAAIQFLVERDVRGRRESAVPEHEVSVNVYSLQCGDGACSGTTARQPNTTLHWMSIPRDTAAQFVTSIDKPCAKLFGLAKMASDARRCAEGLSRQYKDSSPSGWIVLERRVLNEPAYLWVADAQHMSQDLRLWAWEDGVQGTEQEM